MHRLLASVRRIPPWASITFLYLACALWLCQEIFTKGHGLIMSGGEQPDWTGTAWAFWWTETALSQGLSPFDSTYNYFPEGQSPTAWYNLVDAILAAPLVALFGLRTGYNIFVIVVLLGTGLGAHHLSRSTGSSHRASCAAGLLWMCCSWLMTEISIGRVSQAMVVFFLLGLAGLVRMAAGDRRISVAISTGLFVALCALGYWFYGFFLLVAAAFIWGAALLEARASPPEAPRPGWRALALAATVCLALCAWPTLSLMEAFSEQPGVARELEDWLDFGELGRGEFGLSMAILHSNWVLWPWVDSSHDPSPSSMPIIAWLTLIGALFSAWRAGILRPLGRVGLRRWVLLGVTGYLLSLGPYLKLNPTETLPVPLPFLLLHDHLPFFERFWWPDRAAILFVAGMGVLLSHAIDSLREATWRRASWIPGIVAAGILIETATIAGIHPMPATPPRPIDYGLYEGVKGPMLTVPVLGTTDDSRHSLWMQTHHGQPITGGLGDHISAHQPTDFVDFVEGNALLTLLARLSQGEKAGAVIEPADVQELLDSGLVWAVVDHQVFPLGLDGTWGRAFREVFSTLWGQPSRKASRGAIWEIMPIDEPIKIPTLGPLPIPDKSPTGIQSSGTSQGKHSNNR